MKRTMLLLVAAAAICAPISGVSAQRIGIARMTEAFSDDSGDTIKRLAAYEGISHTEARRRLVLMNKAGVLAKRLQDNFPDRFAGLIAIHQPSLHFEVRMQGETAPSALSKAKALTKDQELISALTAKSAAKSAKDVKEMARQLFKEMKTAGIQGEVASNPLTGEIKALVRDPQAFQSAMSRGRFSASPTNVKVEKFSGIQVTADVVGGRTWVTSDDQLCTTGFNVLQASTGVYGVTTAGHCTNSPAEWGGTTWLHGIAKINYVGQWITNGVDLQWGYTSGSGFLIRTIMLASLFANMVIRPVLPADMWILGNILMPTAIFHVLIDGLDFL